MHLNPQQKQMMQNIARANPELTTLIAAWRQEELEQMALGNESLFGMFKGRVQMLTEMQQLLRPSP